MPSDATLKDQRDYAWSYFQLHANQRMTTFNFFVVIAALLTTGLAGTFDRDFEHNVVGVFVGLALVVISFVFWKLDQRVRYLIKHAEHVLQEIERTATREESTDANQRAVLFSAEEQETDEIRSRQGWKPWGWHLSYSDCFGAVYVVFCTLGFLGALAAAVLWLT